GDFSAPNPKYFAFARKVVQKAHDRGIVVWLFPSYLGFGGGDEGFFRELKAAGRDRIHAYGRFVGDQFRDQPNIGWLLGSSFTPDAADQWTVTEVAEGIHEVDTVHLVTGHGSRPSTALGAFGDRPWLTVNNVYSATNVPFEPMLAEYHRRPIRPFVLIESVYEG